MWMLATKRWDLVVKHWDVSMLTRTCLGKLERRGQHYVGHGERSPSSMSARAPGFDYGEDFEIWCQLSYNAARHQECEVYIQISKKLSFFFSSEFLGWSAFNFNT